MINALNIAAIAFLIILQACAAPGPRSSAGVKGSSALSNGEIRQIGQNPCGVPPEAFVFLPEEQKTQCIARKKPLRGWNIWADGLPAQFGCLRLSRVLKVPWGTGPGSVGLDPKTRQIRVPQNFYPTAEGNYAVEDPVRGSYLIFGSQGELIQEGWVAPLDGRKEWETAEVDGWVEYAERPVRSLGFRSPKGNYYRLDYGEYWDHGHRNVKSISRFKSNSGHPVCIQQVPWTAQVPGLDIVKGPGDEEIEEGIQIRELAVQMPAPYGQGFDLALAEKDGFSIYRFEEP